MASAALFDLGEAARVVLLAVTEGEDKPLKYPSIFALAELCIITKVDLLPYVPFNLAQAIANAQLFEQTRLLLDGRHGGEHGGGIAPVKGTLLLFEETQQAAVFLQLVAQAAGNYFPSGFHGFSSPAR